MRRRWPVLLALVAALALPAPAGALENLGTGNVVRNHVVVDGPDAYYARWLKREEGFDVIRVRAGQRTKLPGLREPSNEDLGYIATQFDASDQRYAFTFIQTDDSDAEMGDVEGWQTARPGEALATPEGCIHGYPVIAVDADAVALQPTDCGPRGDITVFDFAPGAAVPRRTIPHSDDEGSVRLAGRYLAYVVGARSSSPTSPNRQIVVYDWVAGTEAYRVGGSEQLPLPGVFRLDRFDLQSDGKLVAASARVAEDEDDDARPPCADRLNVVWWSVAEPQPHVLPVKACNTRARIGNDRIAFFRRAGDAGAQLVTTDLAGSTIAPVAEIAHEGLIHGFDFDGVRAAFAVRGCLNPTVYAELAQPAAPARFAQPSCPVKIAKSAGRVTAGGSALVKLTCPAGCRDLDVEVLKPFRTLEEARIGVGKTATVRLRIPAPIRARLARGQTQRLTVRARHSTFDAGTSYRTFPRRREYTRQVTVLPR